jgi:polar amino acid transport system substrate-binding protein
VRVKAAGALLVAALAVGACSADNGGVIGGGSSAQGPVAPAGQLKTLLPAAVQTAGVLRVGAAVDRAPLLFYGTGTTDPEGLEWEVLEDMAHQLGVSLTLVDLPLVALPSALTSGQVDLIASGYVDLQALEHTGIDFIDDLDSSTAALVAEGNPAHVSGPGDVCGRSVAVQLATAQQVVVARLATACRSAGKAAPAVHVVADHAALLAAVTSHQVALAVDDAVVADYAAEESSGSSVVEVAGEAVDPVLLGIGVRADSGLATALERALDGTIADGRYGAALSQWGGQAAALRTATLNEGIGS